MVEIAPTHVVPVFTGTSATASISRDLPKLTQLVTDFRPLGAELWTDDVLPRAPRANWSSTRPLLERETPGPGFDRMSPNWHEGDDETRSHLELL